MSIVCSCRDLRCSSNDSLLGVFNPPKYIASARMCGIGPRLFADLMTRAGMLSIIAGTLPN
jgi:hypothetical protein